MRFVCRACVILIQREAGNATVICTTNPIIITAFFCDRRKERTTSAWPGVHWILRTDERNRGVTRGLQDAVLRVVS